MSRDILRPMSSGSSRKRSKLITECPSCGGGLTVTHLRCGACELELQGEFEANEFARLSQDKLSFLRCFVGCRGNLREVEAVLGISYPTIRARLDALLVELGFGPVQVAGESSSVDVLSALERGEISVEEAERLLKGKA
jgi:hypothetical protein